MIYLRDSVNVGKEYKVINNLYSLDSTPMQSSYLKWLHEWFTGAKSKFKNTLILKQEQGEAGSWFIQHSEKKSFI